MKEWAEYENIIHSKYFQDIITEERFFFLRGKLLEWDDTLFEKKEGLF
jgi:hypothetical protein